MGDMRQGEQTAQAQGNGPSPGTRVIVDVYADGGPGAVAFSHEWRFEDDSMRGSGTINIPAKKKGQAGTPIQFILQNRTQPRVELRFVNNDNAIWSNRNFCPDRDAHWDSELVDISPNGPVLHLVDLNKDKCVLHYNLRFDPDPQKYCYDPAIKNGGET